ncbi:retrovirus-related Pol polyprotein from transposon 297 [Nephila pilipes]|uniref:Retrovirus-related Pol polyprotein from transposon 297 n=1 Tax=Nephila pilipes TaxID=299642 RepID=A0A8X6PKF4_NEPPI|nr:retrovirus-related Pol polyprotein from transposon 297 [Nephila pilipes]
MLDGLDFCIPYLDDILIATSKKEEHKWHLNKALDRLRKHGLKLNPAKCGSGKSSVAFLECLIAPSEMKPLSQKNQAISDFPKPGTITELRRIFGKALFLPSFHSKCSPNSLTRATKRLQKTINNRFLGTIAQHKYL